MTSAPLTLVRVNLGVWGVEGDRDLAVMTIFDEVFSYVRKRNIGVKIFAYSFEVFYPPVRREAVIVALVPKNQRCFMYRSVVGINYLLNFLRGEFPLNPLG
jgi:hypothetical protein